MKLFIYFALMLNCFAVDYCVTKISGDNAEELKKKLAKKISSKSEKKISINCVVESNVIQKGDKFIQFGGIVLVSNGNVKVVITDDATGKSVTKSIPFKLKYTIRICTALLKKCGIKCGGATANAILWNENALLNLANKPENKVLLIQNAEEKFDEEIDKKTAALAAKAIDKMIANI